MSVNKDEILDMIEKAISSIPYEKQRELINRANAQMMISVVKAVVEKFGEEGWKAIEKGMRDFGQMRAFSLKKNLNIDVNNARELGKVLDFEDTMTGVKGRWVEIGEKIAVKHEFECPMIKVLKDFPEYCTRLMYAMEIGTLKTLNPKVKELKITKLLTKGDDCCEAIIELEK
ncbi:MAG: L-2-amino-thiazoline-4-carboxylic acid hydrolase [Candidatus Jordarchaeum sp.]|uniref:L-2-amino-thiazoline-4-carboxylic acid hydrolase n=1 Tax=Candidatus Jordarchaeum sp. TaxID=2823881 RepID=UPI0040495E6E